MTNGLKGVDWRSVCPISSALDVLGDKWSLLITRDVLIHGPRTYSDFLSAPEHTSAKILALRLNRLTAPPHASTRPATWLYSGMPNRMFKGNVTPSDRPK